MVISIIIKAIIADNIIPINIVLQERIVNLSRSFCVLNRKMPTSRPITPKNKLITMVNNLKQKLDRVGSTFV